MGKKLQLFAQFFAPCDGLLLEQVYSVSLLLLDRVEPLDFFGAPVGALPLRF